VTVTVLVVQMASGSFSARSMRLWYRDPVLKGVLALLIGTLAYSFSLLRRIESEFVPDLGVTLAGVLLIVGLVMFVLFLNRFVHRLRPVAAAALVAKGMRESLDDDIASTRDLGSVFVGERSRASPNQRRSWFSPLAPGQSRPSTSAEWRRGQVSTSASW
jgi:hypothetical protein